MNWSLKLDPADYLSRYPNGRHAQLANQVLDDRINKSMLAINEMLPDAHGILSELLRLMGAHLIVEDDDPDPINQIYDNWMYSKNFVQIWRDLGIRSKIIRDRLEEEKRRFLIEKKPLLVEFGTIGPLMSYPMRPKFWNLNTSPRNYINKHYVGRKERGQNYYLAKAAVVRVEQQVEKTIWIIESEIRPWIIDNISGRHANILYIDAMKLVKCSLISRHWYWCTYEFEIELDKMIGNLQIFRE